MADRKDGRRRRGGRGRKPSREGKAIPYDEDAARRVARDPALDREEVAAREAGIYDEPPGLAPNASRQPTPEPEERPKPKRRSRRRSGESRRRRRPEQRPAPVEHEIPVELSEVPAPTGDERVEWWDEIEDALDGEDEVEDDFDPEVAPEQAVEPVPEPASRPIAKPAPEEEEEDGFDLGIFAEEAGEMPDPVRGTEEVVDLEPEPVEAPPEPEGEEAPPARHRARSG